MGGVEHSCMYAGVSSVRNSSQVYVRIPYIVLDINASSPYKKK